MNEWEALLIKLRAERRDTFLLTRVTACMLKDLYDQGLGIVVRKDDKIIACGFLWATSEPSVMELGTLWVDPNYRGQHHSSEVFERRLALPATAGKLLFIISHETKVAHHARKHGFVECTVATWDIVDRQHTCGPCDRVVESQKTTCPFRAVEKQCRLFVLDKRPQ